MGVRHQRVTVGTTATKVSADNVGRSGQTVLVQNPAGGADIYLGGEAVTTTSYGYLLVGGSAFAIDLHFNEGLYAVVASSTQVVNVIRQGA